LVDDLVETTRKNLKAHAIDTFADVIVHNKILVEHSGPVRELESELKQWLHKNLYTHHKVEKMRVKSEQYLRGLFGIYTQNQRLLPREYQAKIESRGAYRVVCDYIAGMTDRYAIDEYRRLFEPDPM